MKKTLVKRLALVALVLGLASTSVFAKNTGRQNNFPGQMWGMQGKNFHQNKGFPEMGMKVKKNSGAMSQPELLGTISSVDEKSGIITLKDIDGKEKKVHVNPFTALRQKNDGKTSEKGKKSLEISELKAGDYLAVKKMKTETETIEAAKILVVREK